jgi:hypothetical protein
MGKPPSSSSHFESNFDVKRRLWWVREKFYAVNAKEAIE